MKFVLVNGRMLCTQSSCVMCDEPIGAGYLREIGTGLCYCDHDCYAGHCKSAVLALANHARASSAAFVSAAPTSVRELPTRSAERSNQDPTVADESAQSRERTPR
jgi:hypothetical protein